MRLSLALAAAALLLAAPTRAQTQFLVKGGLNTAFFSGSDARGDYSPRLGAVGGAGVRFYTGPQLSLQVEALYSQEGAEDDFEGGTYELDYLDVPILLRFGSPAGGLSEFGLYGGAQIGIPLRAQFDADFGPTEDEQTGTDLAIALGLDYGSGPVFVDARYVIGLVDALDDEINGVQLPFDALLDLQNQTFSVTLGLRFGGERPRRYGRGGRGRY